MTNSCQITELLHQYDPQNPTKQAQLIEAIYTQLKTLATHRLNTLSHGMTMKPTELVHEFFLKVLQNSQPNIQNRRHFFALASKAMRQIIVDEFRRKAADKRGGGQMGVDLEGYEPVGSHALIDMLALDEGLRELEKIDPRKVKMVELAYFGGFSQDEIATELEMSLSTVKRDWNFSRAFLKKFLDPRE